jgi:hypothetical protein
MPVISIGEIFSSACTEVDRMIDRWMIGFAGTLPVPSKVRFINHSIAPVVNIPMTATRYIKSFQGHQFAVGRSKK